MSSETVYSYIVTARSFKFISTIEAVHLWDHSRLGLARFGSANQFQKANDKSAVALKTKTRERSRGRHLSTHVKRYPENRTETNTFSEGPETQIIIPFTTDRSICTKIDGTFLGKYFVGIQHIETILFSIQIFH